jgi:hypothetical protein
MITAIYARKSTEQNGVSTVIQKSPASVIENSPPPLVCRWSSITRRRAECRARVVRLALTAPRPQRT